MRKKIDPQTFANALGATIGERLHLTGDMLEDQTRRLHAFMKLRHGKDMPEDTDLKRHDD